MSASDVVIAARNEAIVLEDLKLLAIHLLRPYAPTPLVVQSSAFAAGQPIPEIHSEFGDRVSPDISIDGVPAGTKSLLLLLEDPDAPHPKPFIHWIIYNLPPTTKALQPNIPGDEILNDYGAARQGPNSAKTTGYYGMKPPASHPPHHYHFQVFALDTMLTFGPKEIVDRALIVAKAKHHILASGDLIGTFQAPQL